MKIISKRCASEVPNHGVKALIIHPLEVEALLLLDQEQEDEGPGHGGVCGHLVALPQPSSRHGGGEVRGAAGHAAAAEHGGPRGHVAGDPVPRHARPVRRVAVRRGLRGRGGGLQPVRVCLHVTRGHPPQCILISMYDDLMAE